jgi:glucokinase
MHDAEAVLAIDLGGTRLKAGIVRGTTVRPLVVEPTESSAGADALLGAVVRVARRLLSADEAPTIGICIKGIVDPRRGMLIEVNESLACLNGAPVGRLVAEALGRPTVVENDARMYALGELLHGSGQGHTNIVCLTLGTGIGCGVCIGGRVLRGDRGVLGILGGHLTLRVHGPQCTCGNTGCLEALIGTAALAAHARSLLASGMPSTLRADALDPRAIFVAAAAGDAVASTVVQTFAEVLGAGVVTMIHAYDPDVVVVGGGIMGSAAMFLPAVQAYADAHAWTIPRARVRVVPAALGDVAALIGVAALARGDGAVA